MRVAKGIQRNNNSPSDAQFRSGISRCELPKKYSSPIPLGCKKFDDLKSYIPDLVPNVYLERYWNKIFDNADLHCNDYNERESDLFYNTVYADYD